MPTRSTFTRFASKAVSKTRLGAAVALAATTMVGCIELPSNPISEDWTDKYKGTQIEEMKAIEIIMDDSGNTYSVGTMALENGDDWAVVRKFDAEGNLLADNVFQANDDGRTNTKDVQLDADGNLILIGKRSNSKGWFVTKLDGISLDIMWDTTWKSDNSNAYSVAVGPSGDAYVSGWYTNVGTKRYAVAKFDGDTGAKEWEHKQGCCFNGAITDKAPYDTIVVTDDNGEEWLYATYPGSGGVGAGPTGINLNWWKHDGSNSGSNGMSLTASSQVQLTQHPDGYIVFAGTEGDTTKVRRIDYGTSGYEGSTMLVEFSEGFDFEAFTVDDEDGSIYIAGNIPDNSPGSTSNDTNAYIAKYNESCILPYSDLCWDHTFNHSLTFSIEVNLLGFTIVDSFSNEEVRDVFVANENVYLLTSSNTTDINVATQQVSELVGYNKVDGEAAAKIMIKASDSKAAMQDPTDPSTINIIGVNHVTSTSSDPDIYMYTRSVTGF